MFQTSLRILLHPMSLGWLIDWPDSHSGFLVALATFTLAGVTAVYVWITHRLVKQQQLPVKREIVELVYPGLLEQTRAVLKGVPPSQLFDKWRETTKNQAFLVSHPFFQGSIRRTFELIVGRADETSMNHARIWERSRRLAIARCTSIEPPPAEGAEGGVRWITFQQLALATLAPGATVESVLSMFDLRDEQLRFHWLLQGQELKPRNIEREWLLATIREICSQIDREPDLVDQLTAYRNFLRSVSSLATLIETELRRAGRV